MVQSKTFLEQAMDDSSMIYCDDTNPLMAIYPDFVNDRLKYFTEDEIRKFYGEAFLQELLEERKQQDQNDKRLD